MKKSHCKLIRDKIPEIIEQSGNQCEWIVLSDAEYEEALYQKLIEEATEVVTAPREELVKELADLYEVIDALLAVTNIEEITVFEMQKQRREARGGFEKKIQLLSTSTSE